MSRNEAILQYRAAQKAGLKYAAAQEALHKSPYPIVLEDIANETHISGQQVLGIFPVFSAPDHSAP